MRKHIFGSFAIYPFLVRQFKKWQTVFQHSHLRIIYGGIKKLFSQSVASFIKSPESKSLSYSHIISHPSGIKCHVK